MPGKALSNTKQNPQIKHYETLLSEYERHYFDITSMEFRRLFYYRSMFANADLNDKDVIELASSSGKNSQEVLNLFPRARLSGLDISPSACKLFQENLNRPAFEADLTKLFELDHKFDVAFVVGGIHHCIGNLPSTLTNIARLLRPGGIFIMVEPNNEFFLESIRKIWYQLDSSFESETEAALNHNQLLDLARNEFELVSLEYGGGPASLLILNSMIFRIPIRIKKFLAPPLFFIERLWNKLPFARAHNHFIAVWRRTPISKTS